MVPRLNSWLGARVRLTYDRDRLSRLDRERELQGVFTLGTATIRSGPDSGRVISLHTAFSYY